MFILPVLLCLYINGYNLFSVFFVVVLLILYDVDFEYKNFLFGLIIGVLVLTKQTVGCFVAIPVFFLSKNKVKFLLGMFLPLVIFFIYLIHKNALL